MSPNWSAVVTLTQNNWESLTEPHKSDVLLGWQQSQIFSVAPLTYWSASQLSLAYPGLDHEPDCTFLTIKHELLLASLYWSALRYTYWKFSILDANTVSLSSMKNLALKRSEWIVYDYIDEIDDIIILRLMFEKVAILNWWDGDRWVTIKSSYVSRFVSSYKTSWCLFYICNNFGYFVTWYSFIQPTSDHTIGCDDIEHCSARWHYKWRNSAYKWCLWNECCTMVWETRIAFCKCYMFFRIVYGA